MALTIDLNDPTMHEWMKQGASETCGSGSVYET